MGLRPFNIWVIGPIFRPIRFLPSLLQCSSQFAEISASVGSLTMAALRSGQLKRLLLRHFSSVAAAPSSSAQRHLPLLRQGPSFPPNFPKFIPSPAFSLPRSFSSAATTSGKQPPEDDAVRALSAELLEKPEADPLSVTQRLALSFAHINPTPALILAALNISPAAGRTVLGFYDWLAQNPNFSHTDETVSFFVDFFGRRKDFKAIDELFTNAKGIAGAKSLACAIDRLVRAGRPVQAVSFFERMERDFGFKRDKESLKLVIEKLCENGHSNYAEKMVKNLANEFFPDEHICDLLIKGWCVDGKLDEANRLAAEMYRGGFEIGPMAYNAILDCVCTLCRKKDPFRMESEAEKILIDMDYYGVPRNVDTFNVLIRNLCKIRKTEDAMKLFSRMGEWGCHPNEETFLLLIRSLYQAARVGEGDEMIDRMKSSGFNIGRKEYYGFLKILCGIERVDHALSVFQKMKADGCEPGVPTYDLLMGKLCSHNRTDRANALFNEATRKGIPVSPKMYKVEPRFLTKPKEKKEKKRETLPEKMARKRRRLTKIKLSFVKKPKGRRAY